MTDYPNDKADWNLTTWEGSRRETLRRWAKLPLENIIAALEEMQTLNEALHNMPKKHGLGTTRNKNDMFSITNSGQ